MRCSRLYALCSMPCARHSMNQYTPLSSIARKPRLPIQQSSPAAKINATIISPAPDRTIRARFFKPSSCCAVCLKSEKSRLMMAFYEHLLMKREVRRARNEHNQLQALVAQAGLHTCLIWSIPACASPRNHWPARPRYKRRWSRARPVHPSPPRQFDGGPGQMCRPPIC